MPDTRMRREGYAQHVKDWSAWVFERSQQWSRRLRGEEGPLPNFNPEAVRAVLAALTAPRTEEETADA